MANYNVLTLSEPVTDFVATTSPETINVQCSLTEDAQRKKVWAVCKAGEIPEHPYDGVRVQMDIVGEWSITEMGLGALVRLDYTDGTYSNWQIVDVDHAYPGCATLMLHCPSEAMKFGHAGDGVYTTLTYKTSKVNVRCEELYNSLIEDVKSRIVRSAFAYQYYINSSSTTPSVNSIDAYVALPGRGEVEAGFSYLDSEAKRTAYSADGLAVPYLLRDTAAALKVQLVTEVGGFSNGTDSTANYIRPILNISKDARFTTVPNSDGSFNLIL